MPAQSQKQQRFMGMVHAYKQGKMKNASAAVKKAAASMSDSDAKKYASTPHKGLPVSKENVAQFHKLIGEYNKYGQILRRAGSLREMSRKMQALAELAERTIMQEADDWFDAHTIKRNMKELKSYAADFGKHAIEAEQLMERVTALYDDMGRVLERYFEIMDVEKDDEQDQIAEAASSNISHKVIDQPGEKIPYTDLRIGDRIKIGATSYKGTGTIKKAQYRRISNTAGDWFLTVDFDKLDFQKAPSTQEFAMGSVSRYITKESHEPNDDVNHAMVVAREYLHGGNPKKHSREDFEKAKEVLKKAKMNMWGSKTEDVGKSWKKGSNKPRIDQINLILTNHQHGMVDGMGLDVVSASAYKTVYDTLTDQNKAKLEALPLSKAMALVWKLVK